MNKFILKPLFFSLFLLIISFCNILAQSPEGKTYITSDCASGGIDYHFFKDGIVIGVCKGCESTPLIRSGSWQIKDKMIYFNMSRQWDGVGQGAPIEPCGSVCLYSSYYAKYSPIKDSLSISADMFLEGYSSEDCEKVEKHNFQSAEVSTFLRSNFGKNQETSERLLSENELKTKSKKELRIMRNEIFARYGYIFKSKDLKGYFEGIKGYVPLLENVDAFLTEIEVKNIELIKKFEEK